LQDTGATELLLAEEYFLSLLETFFTSQVLAEVLTFVSCGLAVENCFTIDIGEEAFDRFRVFVTLHEPVEEGLGVIVHAGLLVCLLLKQALHVRQSFLHQFMLGQKEGR